MSTIVVFLDLEEGHSLPIFRLLKKLEDKGYRICCMGLNRIADSVRRQGFEFKPIIDNVLTAEVRQPESLQLNYVSDNLRDMYFESLVRGEVLDGIMSELTPAAGIFLCHYYLEGLAVRFRYQLPIVFFVPIFRAVSRVQACVATVDALMNLKSGAAGLLALITKAGVPFKNLKELSQLVLQMPELMVLPEAFDLPGRAEEPGIYYIGAGVDLDRTEEPFEWAGINPDQPLIYCSLGSQNHLTSEKSLRFLQVVVDTATAHPELQFIVSIGKTFHLNDFKNVPANVRLRNWVPQLEVLARSDLMINHGGFGAIKESVLMGAPMLAFPLRPERDHFECAKRVVYHGLGLQGDVLEVSPNELGSLIEQVIQDQSFRERVVLMREKFKQQDRLDIGIQVIESVISSPASKPV